MPTYTFRKDEGGIASEVELWMGISEMERWMAKHPEWEPVLSATAQVDPMRMGRQKADPQFRELLGGIKRGNRGSTIEP